MNQNELETTEPAFICKENTGEEMKEVLRIEYNGDVIWRGRKIESDTEFRAAMMELNDSMRKITSELSPLVRLTDDEIKQAILSAHIYGYSLMQMLRNDVDVELFIKVLTGIANVVINAMIEKNGGKS